MSTPAIELTGATKRFRTPSGALHTAVHDLDLTVAQGEFVAVVGPTGCGKSTTLTLVSGLEEPTEGEVRVYGEPVRGIDPQVGFVFQQDAVFPWRTVLSNVMAGPRFRGVAAAEAKERARDWLGRVGLAAFEDRYPHQLSGGMRKRVALAQTFVNDPAILLMDEPFSALDVQTRALMSDQLLELWAGTSSSENAASVVFVTHDLDEAIALADRAGHRQGDLHRRPAATAHRGGRPAGTEVRRAVPRDLGLARRRGAHHPGERSGSCRLRPRPTPPRPRPGSPRPPARGPRPVNGPPATGS